MTERPSKPRTSAPLAALLERVESPLAERTVLQGNLARVSLAEVLQLCQLRRQGGLLAVASGDQRAVAALRDGSIDLAFAAERDGRHRLGRYLRRLGLLSEAELGRALEASSAPLGEFLVAEGLVAESSVRGALKLQSSELVYAMLGWTEGVFVLSDEPAWPEAARARLGLGLGELILEGFRRIDERRRLWDAVDADGVLAIEPVGFATHEARLGPVERSVVEAVDGARTLRWLVDASLHAELDVLGAVSRLLRAKVVRYAR